MWNLKKYHHYNPGGFMEKNNIKQELISLINKIPDEEAVDLEELLEIVEDYLAEREGKIIVRPLENEDHLKPEYIERLKKSEKEIERGEIISLEDFMQGKSI